MIESMAGERISVYRPQKTRDLLHDCFNRAADVYARLPRPPWPDGVPWGSQEVAGHAVTDGGGDCFVGADGDLLWNAATETVQNGQSPLKVGVLMSHIPHTDSEEVNEFVVAAALYDETAEKQVTTADLFAGVDRDHRGVAQQNVLKVFNDALHPKRVVPMEQRATEPDTWVHRLDQQQLVSR